MAEFVATGNLSFLGMVEKTPFSLTRNKTTREHERIVVAGLQKIVRDVSEKCKDILKKKNRKRFII